jgi:hypothetical protein
MYGCAAALTLLEQDQGRIYYLINVIWSLVGSRWPKLFWQGLWGSEERKEIRQ